MQQTLIFSISQHNFATLYTNHSITSLSDIDRVFVSSSSSSSSSLLLHLLLLTSIFRIYHPKWLSLLITIHCLFSPKNHNTLGNTHL